MASPSLLRRLTRTDRGAVFVEFAMVLPLLLVLFATVVEGGRMMWSYQNAVAGVRDATRYLGRIVGSDVCQPGNTFPNHEARLEAIVRDSIKGTSVLPAGVELDPNKSRPVMATLACVAGAYRVSPAPVATVSARIRIELPFQSIFSFAGGNIPPFIYTTVSDSTRVYGS